MLYAWCGPTLRAALPQKTHFLISYSWLNCTFIATHFYIYYCCKLCRRPRDAFGNYRTCTIFAPRAKCRQYTADVLQLWCAFFFVVNRYKNAAAGLSGSLVCKRRFIGSKDELQLLQPTTRKLWNKKSAVPYNNNNNWN